MSKLRVFAYQLYAYFQEEVAGMARDLEEFVAVSSQIGENGESALDTELTIFTKREVAHQSIKHLEHLKSTLARSKDDIGRMLKTFYAKDRCFSEDASDSVIHQTVVQLFKCSLVKDEALSELALKCLGEMGPINLSTLLLNPSTQTRVCYNSILFIFYHG